MMAEDKFLAFKGLKQYDPDSGWARVEPSDSGIEFSDEQERLHDQQHYHHSNDYGHDQNLDHEQSRENTLYIDPHFEKDLNDLSMDLSQHYHSSSNSKNSARSNQPTSEKLHEDINLADPLLSELFEQLNQPPQDELTQNWKIIATSVNILSQRMAQRRDLKERLAKLDMELESLRSNILHDLEDIQKAADQQLSMARLRAEVSTLAQARLASRLKQKNS